MGEHRGEGDKLKLWTTSSARSGLCTSTACVMVSVSSFVCTNRLGIVQGEIATDEKREWGEEMNE